jgi:mannose-6-phosphate isomerase-like protein (cupin superfamily)
MNVRVGIVLSLLAAAAPGAQTPAPQTAAAAPPKPLTSVMFFDHTRTADAFAKAAHLYDAPDFTVQGGHREVPGQVELHDKETDIIYILDGAATFVAGGTMIDGTVSRPGQWLGKDIKGGEEHRMVKGDMVLVPAGTPHWFKSVSPQVTYYVVKIVKP